jgi:hypothetical protein
MLSYGLDTESVVKHPTKKKGKKKKERKKERKETYEALRVQMEVSLSSSIIFN